MHSQYVGVRNDLPSKSLVNSPKIHIFNFKKIKSNQFFYNNIKKYVTYAYNSRSLHERQQHLLVYQVT